MGGGSGSSPIDRRLAFAGFRKSQQLLGFRPVGGPQFLLFPVVFFRERLPALIILELAHHANGPRSIGDVNHRLAVMRSNLDRRVDPAGGGAADQERNRETFALQFPGHVHHLIERGCNEAAQADQVRIGFPGGFSRFSRTVP